MINGDNQLGEAFSRVTILELAHKLGYHWLKEGGGQRSPFRNDKKAGSFLISKDRPWFEDFACSEHRGGHIKFVELSRPGWPKKECIEFIIRAAGMEPIRQSAGAVKEMMKEKRQDAFRAAQKKMAALPKLSVPEPGPMSERIRRAWNDGQAAIIDQMDRLAESRGWPVEVMRSLVGANKTSYARLPWSNGKDNKRGWAFLVEKPVFRGNECGLVPVGYHVRYEVWQDKQLVRKPYVYVPYVPDPKRPDGTPKRLSDFQQFLLKLNTVIPAYPFVLGSLVDPRLVIITEGQYDAVSLSLAFGWKAVPPPGVVVMGLRGVQSCDPLLAAYGGWLRRHKPFVWVIGDNDEAGRNLATRKNFDRIDSDPSFIDRLRAQGCTVAGRFYEIDGCKDFNDIWRAHRPSLEQMHAMATEAGCGEMIKGD